jgi:predicted transposase YbfD/YdcC
VVSQREIPHKTNEITESAPLLEELDLTGVLVSADALHTQRAHARVLVEDKNADYLLTVKDNQPSLFAQLNTLPWTEVPVAHTEHDRGHGHVEQRTIHVLPAPDTINFPHAKQAFLTERYVADLDGNPTSAVTVLNLTSRPATRADPHQIATALRRHIAQGLRWASYDFSHPLILLGIT